jgi:membrane protease YdiL (CAAX protease family)
MIESTPCLVVARFPMDRLAVACWLGWLAGATLARTLGIWAGVGGAAVVLAALVLVRAHALLLPLLIPSPARLAWGLGAAVLMIAGTETLYGLDRAGPGWTVAGTAALYGLLRTSTQAWALLPVVVVAEELVWRGVVQEALDRRLGPAVAVVVAAAAYATAHLPLGSPLLAGVAFACGVYWSALRRWTGSLVPSLVCHLAWDIVVLVLRPLA